LEKVMPTEVKSIRDRPINVNKTKFSQFRLPKIRNATQALPVIIEPVARSPVLKSGLENEKSMTASLKTFNERKVKQQSLILYACHKRIA